MSRWSIKKKNEGSTFLLVIISMIFIAALGITILTISVSNFQMMTIDQASKQNFYEAEAILTEIKMGTAEIAGEVFKDAYAKTMVKYREYSLTPGSNPKDAYERYYLGSLAKEFLDGVYTSDLSEWDGTTNVSGDTVKYQYDIIEKCTNISTAIERMGSDNYLILDSDSTPKRLILENVRVRIKENDYETLITTDLVFTAPNIEFDMGTFPEYANYAMIGNQKLDITNGNVNISGNIYSGPEGFNIKNATVNVSSETFLSRGNLNVQSNSAMNLTGEGSGNANLWVEDIRTSEQSPRMSGDAILNMTANCYVSDDMELNAKDSKVILKGDYRGYNYNKTNELDPDVTNRSNASAKYSSAILINGTNSLLDMSDVNSIVLAGRAFVASNDTNLSGEHDILTSESIAVKSNQIAYLVPLENIDTGNNPSSQKKIIETMEKTGRTTVVHFKQEDPIRKYLNPDQPYTEYHYQVPDDEYVYYFLNFLNDDMADRFMADYYSKNKDLLKNRSGMYITNGNTTFNFNDWNIAGLVFNYPSGLREDLIREDLSDPAITEDVLDACIGLATDYMSLQKTLVKSNPSGFRWEEEDDGTLKKYEDPLFDIIINSEAMAGLSGVEVKEIPLKSGTANLYITNGDCNVPADTGTKGLVIAGGNVNISGNFEGLIISKQTIEIGIGNPELKANSGMVRDIIDWASRNGLAKYFKGVEEKSEIVETGTTEAIAASISYQNWKKNEEW